MNGGARARRLTRLTVMSVWSSLLIPIGILGGLLCSRSALAQGISAEVDISGSQVRYADSLQLATAAFTPTLRVSGRRAILDATGSYSNARDGRWALQGAMTAVWFTPSLGRASGEIAALAGGTTNRDGTRTAQAMLTGRLHMRAGAGGIWVGAGRGVASDTLNRQAITRGEVGGWTRWASGAGSIVIMPTRLRDSLSYVDAQLALQWEWPRLTLGVSGSGRRGQRLPDIGERRTTWGDVNVTAPLIQRLALIASAGTYPIDWMQGFPGGRYVTVGVRLGVYESRTASAESVPTSGARADDIAVRVTAGPSGHTVLSVRAEHARSIELIGDFTNWQPIALIRDAKGRWSITLPIEAGVHQMNIRLDGGAWRVPKGLTPVVDEFGGSVGIVVIPPPM